MRDLTRHRSSLVAERARIVNRLQKVLGDANIKPAAVASDIAGVSARTMLEALAAGERDAAVLAQLAKGRLRPHIFSVVSHCDEYPPPLRQSTPKPFALLEVQSFW